MNAMEFILYPSKIISIFFFFFSLTTDTSLFYLIRQVKERREKEREKITTENPVQKRFDDLN